MEFIHPFIKELEPSQLEELRQSILYKKVKKGTVLQLQGDINIKSYFVKKGLLRSYTIDEKGKEHVFMFAPEGWIISDMESHSKGLPAQLYIDVLEDSELEIVEKTILEKLTKLKNTEYFDKHNSLLINRIIVLQKRVILLMSATAKERYEDFLSTYPNIIQRVPQKLIASYLGITPEALSKIRGQLTK
tara:strand:- start:807 stop:1373 length:567 start_codon:yes stop_codon:yes gene_type:complete